MALSEAHEQAVIAAAEWLGKVDSAACDPRLLVAARYMLYDEMLADTEHYTQLVDQVGSDHGLTPDELAAAIGWAEDALIHQDSNV